MRAKARVSVPIRPQYIFTMRISLAAVPQLAQAPVERPQVVKAEVVSKIASVNGTSGSARAKQKQDTKMNVNDMRIMDVALSTRLNEMVLCWNSIRFFP